MPHPRTTHAAQTAAGRRWRPVVDRNRMNGYERMPTESIWAIGVNASYHDAGHLATAAQRDDSGEGNGSGAETDKKKRQDGIARLREQTVIFILASIDGRLVVVTVDGGLVSAAIWICALIPILGGTGAVLLESGCQLHISQQRRTEGGVL